MGNNRFMVVSEEEMNKRSYRMTYQDSGSRDICFCAARDCKTRCRRNRQLPFFTDWIDYCRRENEPVRYSMSFFYKACRDYER